MSTIPTSTNILTNNANYPTQTDLIDIFDKESTIQSADSSRTTNILANDIDIGRIFKFATPDNTGTALDTGYTMIRGGVEYDLAKVFAVPVSYTYTTTGMTVISGKQLSFNTSGTFKITSSSDVTMDVIIVGGGGGGAPESLGGMFVGGGGGGGVGSGKLTFKSGVTYTITVGSGGIGGKGSNTIPAQPTSGGESSITGGRGIYIISETANGGGAAGRNGGSGGGGNGLASKSSATKGTGTLTYYGSSGVTGGGGGGAGGEGSGRNGGNGITLFGKTYAGGGGSYFNNAGTGGTGGGGNGNASGNGFSGTANTGGGGGAGRDSSKYVSAGNGGSGVVVLILP
jgi:hypothetical protein